MTTKPTKKKQETLYDLLGIAPTATSDEVRRAYRQSARRCHPDLHPEDAGAPARFIHLRKAYDLLSDTATRARYDARLMRERHRRAEPARAWFSSWNAQRPAPLDQLAEHNRMALARSLQDTRALGALLGDPAPAVAVSVMLNPAASPGLIERGAAHHHWSVRQAAASRPDCPIQALQRLAGDPQRLVRLAVARNPAAPATALAGIRLHDDHDGALGLALARHPHAPDRLLAALAAQATETVEAALVERVPPSRPALEVLANRTDGTRPLSAQALLAALDLVAALGLRDTLQGWEEAAARARRAGFWPPEAPPAFVAVLGATRAARLRGRLEKALTALAVDAAVEGESN